MRQAALVIALSAVVGIVCWFLPPLRVMPLRQAQAAKTQATFKAPDYAMTFWRERLTPGFGKAVDATAVLDALLQNAAEAAKKYGRSVGVSDTVYYFISGTGTVVSADNKGIGVSLRGADSPADVVLKTSLLFGNTVRDATGLLDVNEFANSQDFNAISTELNRIVETEVIPHLKAVAKAGSRLRFVAVMEIEGDSEIDKPLKAIPVQARIE